MPWVPYVPDWLPVLLPEIQVGTIRELKGALLLVSQEQSQNNKDRTDIAAFLTLFIKPLFD
jgi:hypothetical protein